jgi:hypothetical protein
MCTAREASKLIIRALTDENSFVRGALAELSPAGISTYEWNKCAINVCMAAFTTHKREEVSVEELRAMQYAQQS